MRTSTSRLQLARTTELANTLLFVIVTSACYASSANVPAKVRVCFILALLDVPAPALLATSVASAVLPTLASKIFNSAQVEVTQRRYDLAYQIAVGKTIQDELTNT